MRKVIGACIMVCAGIYLGMMLSRRYQKREENLNGMIEALGVMKTRIGFCQDGLIDIFYALAKTMSGELKKVFSHVSEKIQNGLLPAAAFWSTLLESQSALCYTERDMLILEEFSKQLGRHDRASEVSQIEKTLTELLQNRKEAKTAMAKEGKLTKSFCVIGSILLVILFI